MPPGIIMECTSGPEIVEAAKSHDAHRQLQKPDWNEKSAAATMMTEKRDRGSFATLTPAGSERGSNTDLHMDGESIMLKQLDATYSTTTYDQAENGLLYREGQLVLQPAPSADPRDPLNLSFRRKVIACLCLCLYGSFASAAELILGAMLPVFALEYAGINPKLLLPLTKSGLPPGDPLKTLSELPNSPPIWHVYLLASLPVLMIGLSNLALIPLAISIGRRPVILICGVIALVGMIWAGHSQSLGSHIAARAVQAIGAGTIESLIPFIIQDIVFVHQRNTWISMLFALQGGIIIALGIASPYIIIYLSWRWIYYICAITAAVFLVGTAIFLPETRWDRTKAEMNGVAKTGDRAVYQPRTWAYDLAFFQGGLRWREGWNAFVDTLRTFFYPQMFFITMLNSAMIACTFAAGYTISPALLTQPWSWPFLHLGLCLLPLLVAAICTGGLTGYLGDFIANLVARKRGKRVPENQLLNLILPTLCAVLGSVIFGLAGSHQEDYHWMVFLTGFGLMAFGFLGANTVGAVYVLECYPHLAGPALVNIASFRCLIAFVLSFKVSEWVADLGYFHSMLIYTGLMAFFAALIPVVWYFGASWRRRWPADSFRR